MTFETIVGKEGIPLGFKCDVGELDMIRPRLKLSVKSAVLERGKELLEL
jgi:hypothetical protein